MSHGNYIKVEKLQVCAEIDRNIWVSSVLIRDVIDSRQVDAPLAKTLLIVASIRQPHRCDRIDKIYPQMPLHLGVKFYHVVRLSAVSTHKKS